MVVCGCIWWYGGGYRVVRLYLVVRWWYLVEYDTIEPSQWAVVSERLVDLHTRRLIVDYARDQES